MLAPDQKHHGFVCLEAECHRFGTGGAVRRSCAVAAARRRVPDWGSIGTALRILFGGAPAVTTCYRAVTT